MGWSSQNNHERKFIGHSRPLTNLSACMERWCDMTSRFRKALRFGGFQDYMGSKRRHNIHSWNVAHIGPAAQLQWAFYCLGGTEASYLEHQKFLKHLPVYWRQKKSKHSHRLDKRRSLSLFLIKIRPCPKKSPMSILWSPTNLQGAQCGMFEGQGFQMLSKATPAEINAQV